MKETKDALNIKELSDEELSQVEGGIGARTFDYDKQDIDCTVIVEMIPKEWMQPILVNGVNILWLYDNIIWLKKMKE